MAIKFTTSGKIECTTVTEDTSGSSSSSGLPFDDNTNYAVHAKIFTEENRSTVTYNTSTKSLKCSSVEELPHAKTGYLLAPILITGSRGLYADDDEIVIWNSNPVQVKCYRGYSPYATTTSYTIDANTYKRIEFQENSILYFYFTNSNYYNSGFSYAVTYTTSQEIGFNINSNPGANS